MGERYPKGIVLDSSPLIYLAKLEALEALSMLGGPAIITPAVTGETSRPALTYVHPDALAIRDALATGRVSVTELDEHEAVRASALNREVPGLGRGECETLAVAEARHIPAIVFERRGRAVARAMGIRTMPFLDLLLEITPDDGRLETLMYRFAGLVDMPIAEVRFVVHGIARGRRS